ncbi:hypothetical protein QQ020_05840 [Fulvivirgaceae bacterium BMA12]|uniref:Lipoprotein n=1 Tax=Agaribacillus aureus TaxID=3051825 RepID=A0ABT8L1H6_9BACT|nr:hypothetical protein [Fulvivirgaceae bacterium BMA12]
MEKIIKRLGLLVVVFVAFSCDDDITEFNINSSLSEEIPVSATEADQNIAYEATIDAKEDSEISKNLEKIKEYEVEEVSFRVADYSGPDTANLSGTLSVGNATTTFSADIPSLNIKLFADEEYTIALSEEQLDALETILLESNQLKVTFTGSVSEVPVSFTLIISAKTKVKVDAA